VSPLPIDPLLPEIVAALSRASRLVLRAPPGAGKTTRVPGALLDAGLAADKHVVVLEPRRIAARAGAEFVAQQRGGRIGDEVGYRVRFEQRGGAATRLWFVTEGVLGRQLVRDPFLEQAGVVVLDEFHERHLQGDVALAVIRDLQASVRPDLKLVVMSATLETERLAAYLDGCPVLTAAGRAYPVAIAYDTAPDQRPLPARVAGALHDVLRETGDGGDVLVFLPGAAEIRRTAAAIEPLVTAHDADAVVLHGDLPLDAQQRALRRGPRRKVVLSTNVAETALTIEGVTTVIDSGLARESRFDAKHGINALRVVGISRAAADQRAGRAGRTAPGRCVRLWTEAEQAARRAHETPEVLRLDLSGTLLELRAWGLRDLGRFRWLDPPAAAAVQRAEQLLRQLGAVDAGGAVTDTGRRMLRLAVSPRLARLLFEAEQRGCAADGALLAALASERDICLEQRAFAGSTSSRWAAGSSDLMLRMQLFAEAERRGFDAAACRGLDLDLRSVRAVARARRQLLRILGGRNGKLAEPSQAVAARGRASRDSSPGLPGQSRLEAGCRQPSARQGLVSVAGGLSLRAGVDEDALLRCVLAGFPDRVVRRRTPGSPRGVMVGGTGVVLADSSVVRDAELFVAVEVDAGPQRQLAEARVRLASAVREDWLTEMFPAAVTTRVETAFDAQRGRVVERRAEMFHDLVLRKSVRTDVDQGRAGEVLAEAARQDPSRAVAVTEATRSLLERLRFLQQRMPEAGWPASVDDLLADAVASLCAGCRSFAEVRAADVPAVITAVLSARQRTLLARDAPAQYRLPSGRLATLVYAEGKPPVVAARIQELFGLTETPRLANGRVALVFELLAPNQRPVQITDDLESFWRRTYPEVRKVLRGRYPKHPWPDDPLTAAPTSRTKRGQ
jgi:ATP-dependent helicase HrpB